MAEAAQSVANDLGRATPVYALLLSSKDVDQDIKRLLLIQGYSWKRSEKSKTSCDHDIDKRCGRFHLRFRFLAPCQMMPNEVVRRYPLL